MVPATGCGSTPKQPISPFLEGLEPRLLLAAGPQIVSHWPTGLSNANYVDVTFSQAINGATFTADDVVIPLATPVLRGQFIASSPPIEPYMWGLQVVGTKVYAAAGLNGLRILNVSNPASPSVYSTTATADNARDVQVVGSLAYVADDSAGLRILNVSNVYSPQLVGSINTPGKAFAVTVAGNLAYVADYTSGLQIINVSNPAKPVLAGAYDTSSAYDIAVVGSMAYVADDAGGVIVLDVSNPAKPVLKGAYPCYAHSIEVHGNLAFVAGASASLMDGMMILDVSNPAAPALKSFRSIGQYESVDGVTVSGSLAYVTTSEGLYVYDVSNPSSPVQVGHTTEVGRGDHIQVIGSLAYTTFSSRLDIVQVGQTVQSITKTGSTSYRVTFADLLPEGTINVSIGPNIADLSGNLMDQDGDGKKGELPDDALSFTFKMDRKPPTAPGAPSLSNDTGSSGDSITSATDLTFTWPAATDSSGIAEYQYRLDGGAWAATTARTATMPAGAGVHVFDVRAVDKAGNIGPASSGQATVDLTAPAAPTNLRLDGNLLSWSPPAGDTDIWQYQYCVDSGDWVVATGTSVALTDVPGGLHVFGVRAVDFAGNAGPACSIEAALQLEPPTDLALDGSVLRWTPGATASGIWVQQYSIDSGPWISTLETSASTHLSDGTMHEFAVRAVSTSGVTGPVATATLTVDLGPRVVSHFPAGLVGEPVDHVDLTFNEPIDPATLMPADVTVGLSSFTLVGSYDTSGTARGVDVVGNLAYVANYTKGLMIFDVSNPAAPVELWRRNKPWGAWSVKVVGSLAFVGDCNGSLGLRIYDVSDPTAPSEISVFYFKTGTVMSVEVVGTTAYVVNDSVGLIILDVSNPAAPAQLGSRYMSSMRDVDVVGTLAYVASDYGLQVFDVSNPASPVEVSRFDTVATGYAVQVVGNLAYVLDYGNGLRIIDISNPASPVQKGIYSMKSGYQYSLDVVGSMAYVAGSGGLVAVDVSDPAAPAWAGACSGTVYGVEVAGPLAYVAASTSGLRVFQVARAAQTVTQIDATTYRAEFAAPLGASGKYRVLVWPRATDLAGNTMDQGADGTGGQSADAYGFTLTVDLTAPSAPGQPTFSQDTGCGSDGVTADTQPEFTWAAATDLNGVAGYEYRVDGGDWTMTAALTAGLVLAEGTHLFEVRAVDTVGNRGPAVSAEVTVDLTAPAAPSGLRTDGAALCWKAAADANGIWKHQVSVDAGPWSDVWDTSFATVLADGSTHSFSVRGVDRAGNVGPAAAAALTLHYGPRVQSVGYYGPGLTDRVDLTFTGPINPATFTADDAVVALSKPVLIGSLALPSSCLDVWVAGSLAYVACNTSGLVIVDVSDPAAPRIVGSWDTPSQAFGVAVSGTLAYVSDAGAGLRIIDVSNPAEPFEVGFIRTPGSAYDVQVAGHLAYVANSDFGLRIIDVSNPEAPFETGYYNTPGMANAVAVAGSPQGGRLAYVADSDFGLRIIDVSDPARPVEVGFEAACRVSGVAVVGTTAYVNGSNSGFGVIDVSDPTAPALVGIYAAENGSGIAAVGSRAYVSDYSRGLMVFDASNPAAPAKLGETDTPGNAKGVQVVGPLAFLADGSGLLIFRIAQQAQSVSQMAPATFRIRFAAALADGDQVTAGPRIADPAGNTMDQDADGTGAEPAEDRFSFLFRPNDLKPTRPGALSFTDDTGLSAHDLVTREPSVTFTWAAPTYFNGPGGYEYRIDGGAWIATADLAATVAPGGGTHLFEVRAVDIAGLAGPVASQQFTIDQAPPAAPGGLRVSGAVVSWTPGIDNCALWKHQYSIDGQEWIDTYFSSVTTVLEQATAHEVAVRAIDKAGNVGPAAVLAFTVDFGPRIVSHWPDTLANGSSNFIDVTFNEPIDPASFGPAGVTSPVTPTLVGFYDTAGAADYLDVVGSLAYVGDGSAGLRIIDVSNPAAPVERSCLDTPGTVCGVQVVGSLAYVADGACGLRVIDVSNPWAPVDLGGCYTRGTAYDVQVVGTLAYVAAGTSGLWIFDVFNPALAPVPVGSCDMPGTAYEVQVIGSLAYVAGGSGGLRIIDVSNPAAPIELGCYDTFGTAYGVQVAGSLAYVADGSAGLRIINVSSPAAPVLLGTYDTSGTAYDVQVAGSLAYVADGSYGLRVFNVSNPAAPVHLSTFNTPGSAWSVQVIGTLAYVADDSSGLRIVRVAQAAQSVTPIDAVTYRVQFPDPPVDGLRQFTVAPGITDLAGNAIDQDGDGVGGEKIDDACSVGFIADTTPPAGPSSLSISSDTGYSSSDGVTGVSTQTFNWSAATDANGLAAYQYRLDGEPWSSSTDRIATLTLTEGLHTFEVRAVDNAGNVGPAKSKQVTVDLTAPRPVDGGRCHGAFAITQGAVAAVNVGQLQRTKIVSLLTGFTEPVKLSTGALTVTNALTGQQINASAAKYDGASGKWDLSGVNLSDGYYTARISPAAVKDLAGNMLASEPTFHFHKLAGDVTGDGRVDAMDYLILQKNLGRTGLPAWSYGDLDGDGDVDSVDLLAMTKSLGASLGAQP